MTGRSTAMCRSWAPVPSSAVTPGSATTAQSVGQVASVTALLEKLPGTSAATLVANVIVVAAPLCFSFAAAVQRAVWPVTPITQLQVGVPPDVGLEIVSAESKEKLIVGA